MFKFIKPHVQAMITNALDYLPGWELVSAVRVGTKSRNEIVYRVNGQDVKVSLPYDFAYQFPVQGRGRVLALWTQEVAAGNTVGAQTWAANLYAAEAKDMVGVEETRAAVEFEPLPEISEGVEFMDIEAEHFSAPLTASGTLMDDTQDEPETDEPPPAKKTRAAKGKK